MLAEDQTTLANRATVDNTLSRSIAQQQNFARSLNFITQANALERNFGNNLTKLGTNFLLKRKFNLALKSFLLIGSLYYVSVARENRNLNAFGRNVDYQSQYKKAAGYGLLFGLSLVYL